MDSPEAVLAGLEAFAVIPVVQLDDPEHAVPLAEALRDGGLPVAEITFRTDAAEAAIRRVARSGTVMVGAGTVTTVAQVERAVAAGATFVVSPGLDRDVVRACRDAGVAVLPGVATPTEIMQAIGLGLSALKLFPASVLGGIAGLRALSAPFPGVRFVPTGGVGPENLADWLREPRVLAVGGSWMVKPALIRDARFDVVRQLTAEAVATRDVARQA